eukprot:410234-Alexandrium_andersonii.AAC.2
MTSHHPTCTQIPTKTTKTPTTPTPLHHQQHKYNAHTAISPPLPNATLQIHLAHRHDIRTYPCHYIFNPNAPTTTCPIRNTPYWTWPRLKHHLSSTQHGHTLDNPEYQDNLPLAEPTRIYPTPNQDNSTQQDNTNDPPMSRNPTLPTTRNACPDANNSPMTRPHNLLPLGSYGIALVTSSPTLHPLQHNRTIFHTPDTHTPRHLHNTIQYTTTTPATRTHNSLPLGLTVLLLVCRRLYCISPPPTHNH